MLSARIFGDRLFHALRTRAASVAINAALRLSWGGPSPRLRFRPDLPPRSTAFVDGPRQARCVSDFGLRSDLGKLGLCPQPAPRHSHRSTESPGRNVTFRDSAVNRCGAQTQEPCRLGNSSQSVEGFGAFSRDSISLFCWAHQCIRSGGSW